LTLCHWHRDFYLWVGDMLREKKVQIIAKLADALSQSTIVIATSYQGVPTKEMTMLRRTLADTDVNYHVVKNTLARLAARRAGKEQLIGIIDGPTAMAFSYGDAGKAAKALNQYVKSTGLAVQIKGGLLGERVLSADEIMTLANLPPKGELISHLMAQLQAPVRSLHNVLSAPLCGLCNVVQAQIRSFTE
jgi:large subunit ribosomal protein L10